MYTQHIQCMVGIGISIYLLKVKRLITKMYKFNNYLLFFLWASSPSFVYNNNIHSNFIILN